MNILFVHRRYPGHFGKLASSLAEDTNHKVVFLSQYLASNLLPKVERLAFSPQPAQQVSNTPPGNPELQEFMANGQAVFAACQALKAKGFEPDVIIAHNGWGVMLYLRSLFPKARIIGHFEWFYNTYGSDVDFLSPALATPEKAQKLQLRNMTILAGVSDADAVVCPTRFQADQFPAWVRPHINVIHEGIDTTFYKPAEGAKPRVIGTLDLSAASHVLTYATRGMEAYRGFPQFMRALPLVQRQFPKLHTVIAGEDAIYYGPRPPQGTSWKQEMLRTVRGLDHTRIHFVGSLPKDQYLTLLQASDAHIYYTVPFVLSWSLLESMAVACPLVASDTAPVQEVLTHGKTGWLVPFFDINALASQIGHALNNPAEGQACGMMARQLVAERYQQADCLKAWHDLIYQRAG